MAHCSKRFTYPHLGAFLLARLDCSNRTRMRTKSGPKKLDETYWSMWAFEEPLMRPTDLCAVRTWWKCIPWDGSGQWAVWMFSHDLCCCTLVHWFTDSVQIKQCGVERNLNSQMKQTTDVKRTRSYLNRLLLSTVRRSVDFPFSIFI